MSTDSFLSRQHCASRGLLSPSSLTPDARGRGNPSSGGARSRTGFPLRSSGTAGPSLRLRCSEWVIALFGVAAEIRSLGWRIRFRLRQRYHAKGLDLGAYHQVGTDGHLEVNTRTRVCTQDIENFVAAHPWATIVDVEMYRDAWAQGAAWAESNSGSCRSAQGNT